MKLKKFYKKIKQNKIKYFFGGIYIYKYLTTKYKKFFFKNSSILELGCGNLENYKHRNEKKI